MEIRERASSLKRNKVEKFLRRGWVGGAQPAEADEYLEGLGQDYLQTLNMWDVKGHIHPPGGVLSLGVWEGVLRTTAFQHLPAMPWEDRDIGSHGPHNWRFLRSSLWEQQSSHCELWPSGAIPLYFIAGLFSPQRNPITPLKLWISSPFPVDHVPPLSKSKVHHLNSFQREARGTFFWRWLLGWTYTEGQWMHLCAGSSVGLSLLLLIPKLSSAFSGFRCYIHPNSSSEYVHLLRYTDAHLQIASRQLMVCTDKYREVESFGIKQKYLKNRYPRTPAVLNDSYLFKLKFKEFLVINAWCLWMIFPPSSLHL